MPNHFISEMSDPQKPYLCRLSYAILFALRTQMSKRSNYRVFCLTLLFMVWEGPLKRDFGAELAVAGRDVSYPGILAASHVKDPLLSTVAWSEMGAWQQRFSHLLGALKHLQLHV